jgi:heme oxygenase (biliverdin-IX-beta and delta-forming)
MEVAAHLQLRARTRDAHDRVDAVFGGADLGARESYGRFLMAHADALLAVEEALDAREAGRLLPDWPRRRRGEAIRADLADLGETPPPTRAMALDPGDAPLWGAVYVLEGSRLGGSLLARQVPAGLPRRYLGQGLHAPGAWRDLLARLDGSVQHRQDVDLATASALAVFRRFEAAGQRLITVDCA